MYQPMSKGNPYHKTSSGAATPLPTRPASPLSPILALALLTLFIFIPGCSRDSDRAQAQADTMPAFLLEAVPQGDMISSDDFAGQALLVNFFATWCPPCRQEVPSLVALQNKYSGRGFTILGISVDKDGRSLVENFMQEMGINYPVVMSAPDTPRNFGNVFGVPTSFIIDRQGRVVKRFEGYVEIPVLEKEIQAVL